MEIRNILYPVDFTDGSEAAASFAADMTRKYGAKLYIIHVLHDIARITGWYVPHISTDEFYSELEKGAKQKLDGILLEELRGYPNIERDVLIGIPEEEIIRFAEANNVDLIIMGTHGRTGMDRVFYGSTADKVVKGAHCAVLTVRPKGSSA